MLEGNSWWIYVQNFKSISKKWLRCDMKHFKNRHFQRHFGTSPRFSQFHFLTDFDSSKSVLSFIFSRSLRKSDLKTYITARHVPWQKNQGPRSSRSRVKSIHFRILGSQGLVSSIHFRILGSQGPTFRIHSRILGSQCPTSGIHFRILGSQGPMTSINFRIQSPPKSHNLESPRSHKYTFQDPESQDPMISRCALQSTVFPRSHELMAYHHNLPPSTYHLKPTTYILKLPHTYL